MARVAVKTQMAGDREMVRRLERVAGDKGMRKVARRALLEYGEELVPVMQARTPRKTGRLQRSERVKAMVSGKKEDLRITLLAGGPDVPYAARVHATHKTQSNFMLSTLTEAAGRAAAAIGAKIDLREAV
ncbi:MAG: HK97 gp10 family phage protein [Thermoleophilia bacterium]|nr:HK97 gp10 family phage protein [Thermoleophilia bacterium]